MGAAVNLRKIARRFTMRFSRQPSALFYMSRAKFDLAKEVGDGTNSSTVMAPLMWIARVFPEAPPAMWEADEQGTEKQVRDHEMLRLLRRPNPDYGAAELWVATLIDYYADGNSYWIKVRDRGSRVVELWWAPHWTMTPKGTDTEFVTHYEYRPGGERMDLSPDDVVHFRYGLDADDPRRGRSPLKSVLREVYTDDEAARFTAALLRNMGVPGLLVSPDGATPPSEEDVKATKAYLKANFSGDGRGEALVMSGPTKVQQFGFSPDQLNLRDLRRIPEERVSAVIGVPAVVAGLGAGLDRSTFTNFAEAREAGYEESIIPAQRVFGEQMWSQLLPDFERDEAKRWRTRVGFDLAHVRVLQPDQDKLATRLNIGVSNGTVRRSEFRRAFGLPVEQGDEVYLVPMNVAEVPVDGSEPRTFTPPRTTDRRAATVLTADGPVALTAAESANGHVEVPS